MRLLATIFPCRPAGGKSCHSIQTRKPPDPWAEVSPDPGPTDGFSVLGASFAGLKSSEGPRPNDHVRFVGTYSTAFSA
jgi:hypothetical protein